jgi:hypothetical protein
VLVNDTWEYQSSLSLRMEFPEKLSHVNGVCESVVIIKFCLRRFKDVPSICDLRVNDERVKITQTISIRDSKALKLHPKLNNFNNF